MIAAGTSRDVDSPSFGFRLSNRVAMLYDGKVRVEGTPDEIRASEDPVVKGFVEGRPELLEAAP